MLITGLPPRAIWAMRADEAVRMIDARSKLNQQRRQAGQNASHAGSPNKPDVETIDLPGGRREVRFHSLSGLRTILQRAPQQEGGD